MKLGILYPSSAAHPEIAIDFMGGLKTFFKKAELESHIQLFAESIGYGGVEKEVYQKSEKLIMISAVDVLVAFIDLKVLPILEPLIFASGKLMIVVNPGANYPQNWIAQPNIIFLTLHHAFLCWLCGASAAKNNPRDSAMATSLYDCGYMHSAAMIRNFVKSGGSLNFNYINKQTGDQPFQIDELMSFLSTNTKADHLLCVFDSVPAFNFYKQLSTFDETSRLHLFASPMMLEDKALSGLPEESKFSISGYTPWQSSSNNAENREFKNYYVQQTRRPSNIFALLGWETGLILQQVFQRNNGDYAEGEDLVNQLLKIKLNGPRGELKFDENTHYILAPVVQYKLNKGPGPAIESIKEIDEEWLSFVSEPFEGISSGWTNTYLCY